MPKRNLVLPDDSDPAWCAFWAAYKKRKSKKDAKRAWAQLNPSPALQREILSALEWQFRQFEWLKEDMQFAPLPATYLRAERWTDEPVRVPTVSKRTQTSLQGAREFLDE